MKGCIPEKHSRTEYCTNIRCLHHHTITVQGIRNDDQSLSPVTPVTSLVSLLFSVVPNPLKCSKTFFFLLVPIFHATRVLACIAVDHAGHAYIRVHGGRGYGMPIRLYRIWTEFGDKS